MPFVIISQPIAGPTWPPGSAAAPAGAAHLTRRGHGYRGHMTTPAAIERRQLCDLFEQLGPDAPTLCGGWLTADLAAHLVVRERRPDAAAGLVVKPLAAYTERVQQQAARAPWIELVARVRSGPPLLSPTRLETLDRIVNTVEFFVHHEDVRRARNDWTVRALGDELTDDLHAALQRTARLLTRKAPAGIILEPSDGRSTIIANRRAPEVVVRGPVGELTMFVNGRQDHAEVDLDGPAAAVAALRTAAFGI